MARLPRLYVKGCSHHVIQRGNNRHVCFFAEADYAIYLDKLRESSEKYKVSIHAFVLMTNHVHLLLTPKDEMGVGRMMQALGRFYVRYVNTIYQRSGTLWEGRYKSTLVDSDAYYLTVSRYIELNPVRAGMVDHPIDYPWSSCQANGAGKDIRLLTPHRLYTLLGKDSAERQKNYRGLFDGVIAEKTIAEIREATNKSWVLGHDRFKQEIEHAANRRLESLGRGGDRKSTAYHKRLALLKEKSRTLTP
jgi:putative transposase